MLDALRVRAENVVVKDRFPHLPMLGRQMFERQQTMQQAVERRISRSGSDLSFPPIVDQHVVLAERLDVMPPQRRNIDGVARSELRDQRRGERFAETRKALDV